MLAQVRAAARHTHLMELRLDWLKNKRELNLFLAALWSMRLPLQFLATCRRYQAGGKFMGDPLNGLAVLRMAQIAGSSWSDVEWETLREQPRGLIEIILPKSKLLISLHDFRKVPRGLPAMVQRIQKRRPHATKIAVACRSIADSLRVLALARGRSDIVAVPMGEIGLPARVLALRHGSALAYASVGAATAPGQLSLEEMTTLYRAHRLNRATRVYGVIGNPVAHSLSPLLHNTAFVTRRLNSVYLPFLVRDLPDFLRAIEPFGVAGFSVTLPHKEKLLAHLDWCDVQASAIGAVNTVVVKNGKLLGYNTDAAGILHSLERFLQKQTLAGMRILICGAGGAARAAAVTIARAGAAVCICARRPQRARALARLVGGEAILRRHVQENHFDVIVNATPLGMHPWPGQSPLRAVELNCRLVFDLVYRPQQTKLLRLAARRGIKTISGVEMFLHQGYAQWKIWTNQHPPEREMRAAVLQALKRERQKSPA
jgi:3-dehydroquinate dehydratase/shikimate dehydrogenase